MAFWFSFGFIILSASQPILESTDDKHRWLPTYDEKHKNWDVYTLNIDAPSSEWFEYQIKNFSEGDFYFEWNATYLGRIGEMEFYWNGQKAGTCESPDWRRIGTIRNVKKEDNLKLRLRMDGGHAWIAFPPSISENQPPNQLQINSSFVDNLCVGELLHLSAYAIDPENDDIRYVWYWDDGNKNETTDWVRSGVWIPSAHSWNKPGKYEVRVKAIDKGNPESNIYISSNVTVKSCIPLTPVSPKGSDLGYLEERYEYSIRASSIEPNGKIAYIFNWSDGTRDNYIVPKEVGGDASIFHTWVKRGKQEVKVKALNLQNESSGWSSPLGVDIFEKKIVTHNLQKEIDDSKSYTELILSGVIFNVGTISIRNKDHLIIKSSHDYVKLTGQDVIDRIKIDNSTFIEITKMNLEKCKAGINITNKSSNLKIIDNKISFDINGLILESGENNTIKNNKIGIPSESLIPSDICIGIIINDSKNNYIGFNDIYSLNDRVHIIHYRVLKKDELNNTIEPKPEQLENGLQIRQGQCACSWGIDGFYNFCNVKDDSVCSINYDGELYPSIWRY